MKYFRWWVIFLGMAMIIGMLSVPPARADNVLIVHQNYSGVNTNIGNRLIAAGHTVTYTTSDPTNLTGYKQVWDLRYNVAVSGSLATLYDNFLKNSGFLYLTTENPGCCAVRNNSVATFISNAGGGATTIGGTAGSTSNTLNVMNTTYMTPGTVVTFAAGSAILNSNGTWLFKDASGKVGGMVWIGNAGDLGASYTGTIMVVSDINWTDNTYFNANNLVAVDDLIEGVVAGTVSGTISATGTGTTEPTLCCGGSASPFNVNVTNVAKVSAFTGRTTSDSKVNIEQIGNSNTTIVDQSGTKNNYVNYYVNGSSNTASITQSGNVSTQVNYVDLSITGNTNTTNITQTSTGGGKGAFVNINGNNNILNLQQSDSGNHYAEVSLSGGNKTVGITQSGSGGHMASITMSGYSQSLNLQQTGSTQQFYSINTNCATAGGCSAITVTQGN